MELSAWGMRTYASEPHRGRRRWKRNRAAQRAVYANRSRIRGKRGQWLLRQRGELLERPFAHYLDHGRMRRVHLRGHENILKRLLVHVAGRMNRNNCVMGLRLCASAETIARMSAVWEVFELPTQATFARPLARAG